MQSVIYLLVFAIATAIVASESELVCEQNIEAVINEINLEKKNNAFIEIKLTSCNRVGKYSVKNKVLIIFGLDDKYNMILSDLVNLNFNSRDPKTNSYGLFTIGNSGDNMNLYRNLKYEQNGLHGISLLDIEDDLSILRNKFILNSTIIEMVKESLDDFVVHSNIQVNDQKCEAFTSFYINPIPGILIQSNEYSVSRCIKCPYSQTQCDRKGYFQTDTPTPGRENKCINVLRILRPIDGECLAGDDDCKVVINEINTGSPEKMKKMDFIELQAYCKSKKKVSLQGYKIIGISAGTGKCYNTSLYL